jgi:hypothetical protein
MKNKPAGTTHASRRVGAATAAATLASSSEAAAKPDEVAPHDYVPSALHMGDCNICGNRRDHPIHAP